MKPTSPCDYDGAVQRTIERLKKLSPKASVARQEGSPRRDAAPAADRNTAPASGSEEPALSIAAIVTDGKSENVSDFFDAVHRGYEAKLRSAEAIPACECGDNYVRKLGHGLGCEVAYPDDDDCRESAQPKEGSGVSTSPMAGSATSARGPTKPARRSGEGTAVLGEGEEDYPEPANPSRPGQEPLRPERISGDGGERPAPTTAGHNASVTDRMMSAAKANDARFEPTATPTPGEAGDRVGAVIIAEPSTGDCPGCNRDDNNCLADPVCAVCCYCRRELKSIQEAVPVATTPRGESDHPLYGGVALLGATPSSCLTGEAMVTAVDLDGCTARLYYDGAEDRDMRKWAELLGKTVDVTATLKGGKT
jgi:hypothetical protein